MKCCLVTATLVLPHYGCFPKLTKDQKNKRDSPRIGSARDQATNKYKLSGGVVIVAKLYDKK